MQRKPMIVIGIVLVVLVAATLIWPKFSYAQRETLVDVEPLNVAANTMKSVPLSIPGGVLLASGAVSLVVGARKS